MDSHNPLVWAWLVLASLAGAVTSIAFRPYKDMTWRDILLAFVVSSTFAIFVGSAIAEWVAVKLLGGGQINLRVYGAVMWFMAAAAYFIIPVLFARAKRWVGETEFRK